MTGWAWAALALYAFWRLAAFAVRAVIQHRRTGDSGFHGLRHPWLGTLVDGVLFVAA